MAGWQTSTTLAKITLISSLLGCIALIVGLATPYWSYYNYRQHSGIWGYCYNYCPSVLIATRAMMVLGAIFGVFCLILLFLKMFIDDVRNNKWIRLLPKICLPLTVLFIVIGVVVFGTNYSYLHWSYGVSVVSGILFALAAICYLIDRN